MVADVTSRQEFDQALTHDGLVVVDFHATWCGPCKALAPVLEKFAQQYTAAKFIKVDVDNLSDVAQQYEVTSMPTILFLKGGKVITKVIGFNPKLIQETIASNA